MFYSEAGLAKNIGQSSFGQSMVLRNNGVKGLFKRSLFERNVTALLAQFYKSSALERAHKALSGNTRQLRHLPGDFDDCPERLILGGAVIGTAPGFEVKFNRFTEIRARGFDVSTLRSHIEFGAAGHIKVAVFRDKGREAVGHVQMLMEADRGSKLGGLND